MGTYSGDDYGVGIYGNQTGDPLVDGILLGSQIEPGQLTYFDDLHAIREFLYRSVLEPKEYILQRQEGVFDRGTFMIQTLNQNWVPKGAYWGQIDHNILIQFFGLNYLQAMSISNDLTYMFGSPGDGLVLPYYDVTVDPPEVLYDSFWSDRCGFPLNSVPIMGFRVLQNTIVVNHVQEEHDVAERQDWSITMNFRALAPRVLYDYLAEKPIADVILTGFVARSWLSD